MATTELLRVPYALRDGGVVHVSAVDSGFQADCRCPACEQPLVARKGEVRVHHFAHQSESECSGETVLHELGKRLLFDRIQAAIAQRRSLPITWDCTICSQTHSGDLVKKARSALLESPIGSFKPDIALLDGSKKPFAAVEIVVTHAPDPAASAYYQREKIAVVVFALDQTSDLERLANSDPITATSVSVCATGTAPRAVDPASVRECPACRGRFATKVLHVASWPCYRCNRTMLVAYTSLERGQGSGPEGFAWQEVRAARARGAILERRFSKTTNSTYLANVCGKCNAFIGEHFMIEHIIEPDMTCGQPVGIECPTCGKRLDR